MELHLRLEKYALTDKKKYLSFLDLIYEVDTNSGNGYLPLFKLYFS